MRTGKVYSIETLDRSIVYIGSTTMSLTARWNRHLASYRAWVRTGENTVSLYPIMFERGPGEFNIRLISIHDDLTTREELLKHEQSAIDQNPGCININRAHLPDEVNKARSLAYRKAHRQELCQRAKVYYKANYEKVLTRSREKRVCGCGGRYNVSGETCHKRTNLHQRWLETRIDDTIEVKS
jgi:hypothetical protein